MDCEDSMAIETLSKFMSSSRSHNTFFREEECEALVDLVEQQRSVLMNPLKNAEMCHAKDRAWAKLCRLFNARGFPVRRNVDQLRVKWENIKKSTRKKTNNLQEVCFSEHDQLTRRVLALLCQAPGAADEDNEIDESIDANKPGESDHQWDVFLEQDEDNERSSQNGDDVKPLKYSRESRSLSFTAQECNVLLQCVKAERKHIFNKYTNSKANRDKNLAWARITEAFNKEIIDHNRTTKVLRTKFENMKKMARAVVTSRSRTHKHNGVRRSDSFDERIAQTLKKEQGDVEDTEEVYEAPVELEELLSGRDSHSPTDLSTDPLSSILTGYTRTECEDGSGAREDPQVVRLKIELLNYQLETAKMERQRVTAAMESDLAERAKRDQLLSMQLHEARLNLAAAEQRHYPPPAPAPASTPIPTHHHNHFPVP